MQADAKKSVDSIAAPDLEGIASVMNIVLPGKTSHPVIAMVSNRTPWPGHRHGTNRSAATVFVGR